MQLLGDKVMNMGTGYLKKTLPANIEAEQALLGSVLLLGDRVLVELDGIIEAMDFHDPRHRVIFSAMERLLRQGRVIDLVTIIEELITGGQLEQAGGAAYLASLTETIPVHFPPQKKDAVAIDRALEVLVGKKVEAAMVTDEYRHCEVEGRIHEISNLSKVSSRPPYRPG